MGAIRIKRLRVVYISLFAVAFLAGCNNGPDSPEHSPSARLRMLLAQAADSGAAVALVTGDSLQLSPQTVAYYRTHRFVPAWLNEDADEPSERAATMYAVLLRATDDGLDPAAYGVDRAQRIIEALTNEHEDSDVELDDDTRADYLADLELLLSEGFVRYTTDLVQGTIPPEQVGRAWRIPRNDVVSETILRSAARGGDPQQIVQRLRPATPYYHRMMAALQRLRQIKDAGGWPQLPETAKLSEGDSSAIVTQLRARLQASSDSREAALAARGAATPNVFDRDLRDALRHFQARHAIDDDGQLGSNTLRELNHTVDERIAEVSLNLDRWRWLPNQLGDFFILVNIAGFELEVVENNRAIEAMNVVVGKPGWNTPVFADTMEHLVVNPYWTPPKSIVEEEILPAIANDPSYLERNGFERTSDGGFRQRPGRKNALGQYKFMFPNDDDIYLHDTPADHLFSRARRDFSHGCIRLERPADLARLIVTKATSQSPASLAAMVETGREKWIPLKRPIPIYIVYFTTWVSEDGTLRFHHDVYGHDEELQEAARDSAVVSEGT